MFRVVAQTGQTKPPLSFYEKLKVITGSLSCLEGEGGVRGIQLLHASSPLYVTEFYPLQL